MCRVCRYSLTHRDCAQACLFITGHARADGVLNLEWETIALKNQTVVIYMGLTMISQLCAQLVKHGLPENWPVAVVEKGTLPEQRVCEGTLATLPDLVAEQQIQSPALVIIGEVVRHRVISPHH